jgi:hypothetical protein
MTKETLDRLCWNATGDKPKSGYEPHRMGEG